MNRHRTEEWCSTCLEFEQMHKSTFRKKNHLQVFLTLNPFWIVSNKFVDWPVVSATKYGVSLVSHSCFKSSVTVCRSAGSIVRQVLTKLHTVWETLCQCSSSFCEDTIFLVLRMHVCAYTHLVRICNLHYRRFRFLFLRNSIEWSIAYTTNVTSRKRRGIRNNVHISAIPFKTNLLNEETHRRVGSMQSHPLPTFQWVSHDPLREAK